MPLFSVCLLLVCAFNIEAFLNPKTSLLSYKAMNKKCIKMHINDEFPIENDLIIRAARGEKVEKTPIWIFRQAGRHLPEYNDYKKEKGKNFLELLDDPVDVAEVTMQPIRRYNLDAAILFSDILVILQALGMKVTMPGGVGIQVPEPIISPEDFYNRIPTSIDVRVELKHVIDAVALIKKELKGKVPLIGFSAAPWTLMYYLLGGSSKKNQEVASSWLLNHPVESKKIMDLLSTIIVEYLCAQVDAGADLIQVFEAMGEYISETDFHKWALPTLKDIATNFKKRHPDVPLLVFPRGACYAIASLQAAGYDIVTIDTKTDRATSRHTLVEKAKEDIPESILKRDSKSSGLQGNLDVSLLTLQDGVTLEESQKKLKEEVNQMLIDLGPQNLIANLGEGLTGKEDPMLVSSFIDNVHEISSALISK